MSYERFRGTGEFGEPLINRTIVATADIDTSFLALDAQRWIDIFRVEKQGRLDMDATADNAGVELIYAQPLDEEGERMFTPGIVRNLETNGAASIVINPDWHVHDYPATFGWLLGSIYLETACGVDTSGLGRHERINNFCNLFGRQLMMPAKVFVDFESLNQTTLLEQMMKHGSNHQDVIHQLMLHDKLARRISFDTRIGDVQNPVYANRIDRYIVCLDCELMKPHDEGPHPETTPNFDFSGLEWSGNTSYNSCSPPHDLAKFIALNRQYGTWSDEDDALIDEEYVRELRQREELSHLFDEPGYPDPLDLDSDENF